MPAPERVTAAVLIIGDEILSGRTQDTNLRDIARYLGVHGVDLAEARTVPDVHEEIIAALDALRGRYDYVITTGGIGPTHDDITADAVAAAFGVKLYEHPEIIAQIEARVRTRPGAVMNAAMRRMARVPEGGELVPAPVAAPPGFTIGNVFVLAGVPTIMRAMPEDVGPRLKGGAVTVSRTVRVEGSGESVIAAPLEAVARGAPGHVTCELSFLRRRGLRLEPGAPGAGSGGAGRHGGRTDRRAQGRGRGKRGRGRGSRP